MPWKERSAFQLWYNKTPADQRDIFRPKSFEQQNRFKSKNLYKYISHGTKFISIEFCECTSSYYVNNNSWQFCKKNPFDLNIFLSHMKYGRKIVTQLSEY